MKKFIKRSVEKISRYAMVQYKHIIYVKQFRSYLKINKIPNKETDGEKQYLEYWRRVYKMVEPYSYRLFIHYIGKRPDIIPEDIGHSFLEYYLNPEWSRGFYQDKNLYETYLPGVNMPNAIIRRVGGSNLLTNSFTPVNQIAREMGEGNFLSFKSSALSVARYLHNYDKIVLKPSYGSQSGLGVKLFKKRGDVFESSSGEILSGDYLEKYDDNFIIQEAVSQHPYLSQFNNTSVNTLRIVTYRSVTDESISVTSAAIRIGKEGSFVDNAHAGGVIVGVDVETGQMQDKAFDSCGRIYKMWNGVNFEEKKYTIPHWKEITFFVKHIAAQNHHCRLLGMDIALDSEGNPCLIEYNVSDFGFWIPQFTGNTVFGDKTEEVVRWVIERRNLDNNN